MANALISADCHVDEPHDLWSTRLPAAMRDRGPRLERRGDATAIVVEDHVVRRFRTPGGGGEPLAVFARGATPDARLADLDVDGVDAEVMYPNLGFFCAYTIDDPQLQQAVCAVYNEWVAATFAAHSSRCCPVALLPAADPALAAAELCRLRSFGLRAGMLPVHADARPYNDRAYDPVWEAAEEEGIPLSFHAGTGRTQTPAHGDGAAIVNYVVTVGSAFETVAYLCGAGVLARHPGLRVVMAETGSGWLAWTLHAMDDAAREHAAWVRPKLDLLPSEYFRRQGAVTFQHDPVGLATIEFTGSGCLMWGSDYPHPEGTWPDSARYLETQFAELDPKIRDQITCTNAAELYRFDLAGLAATRTRR